VPQQQRQENNKSQERHPPAQGRPRPDHQHHRTPQESRRKRGDQRASSWGDGVDRAWCTRALTFLPETFPAESHTGAATIAPRVVDRREQMILLCNYSHSGEHQWPPLNILLRGGDALPEPDGAEN
jgi:hypothetical protein